MAGTGEIAPLILAILFESVLRIGSLVYYSVSKVTVPS